MKKSWIRDTIVEYLCIFKIQNCILYMLLVNVITHLNKHNLKWTPSQD